MKKLAEESAPVLSFHEEARTLEQVYLKVMAAARGKDYAQ